MNPDEQRNLFFTFAPNQIVFEVGYNQIFVRLYNLICHTGMEWDAIEKESPDQNATLTNYSLPLIGIATLASFAGVFLNIDNATLQYAIQQATFTFLSLFSGIYTSYFVLDKLFARKKASDTPIKNLIFNSVAYPSGILPIGLLISELFPVLLVANVGSLYYVALVWLITKKETLIGPKERWVFVAVSSLLSLGIPAIVFTLSRIIF